jgi:hypothetical protein
MGGGQHDGAQRRPVASRVASVRVLARVDVAGRVWARLGPVNADVDLVRGKHGQLQEGQGRADDMVEWPGWERRGDGMVR